MKKHLLSLLIVLIALPGCRQPPKKPAPTVGKLPAGSFTPIWTTDLDLRDDRAEHLYLEDDSLFVYTQACFSHVLNRAGGQIEFITRVGEPGGIIRRPIVLPDYIVYPTGSSLALYTKRGLPARSISLPGPSGGNGIGAANMIYIGLRLKGAGRLVAIDVNRASDVPRWELLTAGSISGAPALFEKIIYVGSEDGKIAAVSEDRSKVWALPGGVFDTRGSFVSDLHADESGVYASNTDSKLYVLDRLTGKIKWQYYSGTPLKTPPVVTATTVYQFVPGRGIVALDKVNGAYNREPRWAASDATQFLSEDPANAYLRRRDNTLIALDKHTGQLRFTSRGQSYELFTSNTTASTIYAATRAGRLAAIRPVLSAGEIGPVAFDFQTIEPGLER